MFPVPRSPPPPLSLVPCPLYMASPAHPTYLLSSGSNARGQLAINSADDAHTFTQCSFRGSPPGTLPDGVTGIAQIACGSNFTLLLLNRAHASAQTELWASGDGGRGQLGPLYNRDEPSHTFVPLDLRLADVDLEGYSVRAVAAGWETSYAILTCLGKDDVLISLGANDFGDLGVSLASNHTSSFGQVHKIDVKPPAGVEADSTLAIDFVVAGTHHAIAQCTTTQTNGEARSSVVGWGTCRHDQLGPTSRPASIQTSPIHVDSGGQNRFRTAAAGSQHTVLLRSAGVVVALGSNRKQQVAGLNSLANISAIDCTWNGTYAVLDVGGAWSIVATGDNAKGQLGSQNSDIHAPAVPLNVRFPFSCKTHKLLKMACGSEHVLCLFSTDTASPSQATEVWGWGWNEHGNLGLGHTEDVRQPTKLWPQSTDTPSSRPIGIWAGCGTSWILIGEDPA